MPANIKQITNYDLTGGTENLTIHKAGSMVVEYPYYTVTLEISGVPQDRIPVKIGYCCEPKGIGYPIFLKGEGIEPKNEWKEFQVGKTGMFEFQPETFKDANAEEPLEEEIETPCSAAKVPANIKFTLDYYFE